ncbi:MAG: hypothetical protein ABJX82_10415, partial [Paracoccaceae bacterium]
MFLETPLAVVGKASLRFSKLLFEVGVQRSINHPSQIHAHRPQRLPSGFILLDANYSLGIFP